MKVPLCPEICDGHASSRSSETWEAYLDSHEYWLSERLLSCRRPIMLRRHNVSLSRYKERREIWLEAHLAYDKACLPLENVRTSLRGCRGRSEA